MDNQSLCTSAEQATCTGSEQKKLSDAQNEPSIEAKTAQLRQEILTSTKKRLKIAKQYTVYLFPLISVNITNFTLGTYAKPDQRSG
jgi:hypothetical protein